MMEAAKIVLNASYSTMSSRVTIQEYSGGSVVSEKLSLMKHLQQIPKLYPFQSHPWITEIIIKSY